MNHSIDIVLEKVYGYLLGEDSIPNKIHLKKTVSSHEWLDLMDQLDILIGYYTGKKTVPKRLAECFVDIQNAFSVRSDFYSDEQMNKFEDWGIQLVDKAYELLSE